jgi:hypothetical protein
MYQFKTGDLYIDVYGGIFVCINSNQAKRITMGGGFPLSQVEGWSYYVVATDRLATVSEINATLIGSQGLPQWVKDIQSGQCPIVQLGTGKGPLNECQHQWSTYIGLTQGFDYCLKCDSKK